MGAAEFCVFLVRRYVSLWFLNKQEEVRVSPACCSQLVTAAVCTEQHQMKVVSSSQSYLTQLIEYGEGLQHTPELERRHQKICVACCRLSHEVPSLYHISNSINTQKKSRHHTSNNQTTTTTAKGLVRVKLQRSAAAAAAVAVAANLPCATGIIMI